MTNTAKDWPGMPSDMSSPAEIEAMAQRIADLPNGEARKPLLAEYKAAHSEHVMRLVTNRAREILEARKQQ